MKEYKIVGEHLTKQYKNRKVVNDVSMHVVNGEIYGLVGPNGAGKSTMLKMLLNLTKPDMGEFTIDGVSVQKNGYQTLRKVGAIIENPYFYEQLTGPRIAFTAFAIKLSVFEKVGCFDDRVHINPDWTAWLKLSPKGKFQYIPETVANYRVYSRPEIVLPRIKRETIDAEIICNSIQKNIVDRYDLNVSLWKVARRVIAERKVECHRRFNLEFKYIYELYNVSEDEVKSITLVSRWILKLRELFFKF